MIVVSATFYALVDWHASRIMNSIKTLIAEDASVIRDGQHQTVPARDLVVGDVVTLAMGDRVPADLRLVQISSDVRFDRSLLTGERYVIVSSYLVPTPSFRPVSAPSFPAHVCIPVT